MVVMVFGDLCTHSGLTPEGVGLSDGVFMIQRRRCLGLGGGLCKPCADPAKCCQAKPYAEAQYKTPKP